MRDTIGQYYLPTYLLMATFVFLHKENTIIALEL